MGSSREEPAGNTSACQGFQENSLGMGEAEPIPQHRTQRAEEDLCSRSQTAFTFSWSWQRRNILPSNFLISLTLHFPYLQ